MGARGVIAVGSIGETVRRTPLKIRFLGFAPVLAWLFIQLAMIGVWSPGMSAAAVAGGQTVVICTGDGLVTLVFDADGNPVEGGTQSTQSCEWCTGFSSPPTLVGQPRPAALDLRLIDYTYAIQADGLWHPRPVCDGFPIRAPPFQA